MDLREQLPADSHGTQGTETTSQPKYILENTSYPPGPEIEISVLCYLLQHPHLPGRAPEWCLGDAFRAASPDPGRAPEGAPDEGLQGSVLSMGVLEMTIVRGA